MYQALYRQYRPKTFDELLGQDHVTTTLKNQIERENIGHAYLFSGTRGTGKTSAAKIFARAVNCLEPVNGNPCNKCSNCKEILEETTMDVIEMDAASNNSVEDIRDLRDKVVYPPSRIKYKVYIIDEVHMLSKGAFNALLKTLEEPPSHLIFILATTESERLPQTILSRCQRFDFKRITNKDIVYNMENIIDDIDVEVEEDALRLIARNSEGAMRDALSLLDQCISYDTDKITYEDAINILGVTNIELLFDLVDDIKDNNVEKALLSIDNIIQEGKDIEQFIKDLINHFRSLMIVKSSKKPEEILDLDNIDKYISQGSEIELDFILNSIEILSEAESQSKWSSQPRIILEMAVIKMVQIENRMSLENRIKRLEEGYVPQSRPPARKISGDSTKTKVEKKEIVEPNEEVKKEVVKPVISSDTDIDISTIEAEWKNILNNIRSKKINIYALIIEGKLVEYNNDMLTINYDEGFGFHKEAISSESNKAFVEEIVSNYFGRKIIIDFTMGKKKVVKEEVSETTKNLDDSIEEVISIFGEDIVEIK